MHFIPFIALPKVDYKHRLSFYIYCHKTHVLHLLGRGSSTNGRALKMLSGHSSVLKQIFRPVQLVVLAAEGKNLDRGSSNSGRTVKILSGPPPVLKLYMCKFSDLCFF